MSLADRYSEPTTAVLGGIAAVAGSYAVAGSTPSFVVVPINAVVVSVSPPEVVAFAIQTLGHLGEQLAFAMSVVLTVALLTAATWVGTVLGRATAERVASTTAERLASPFGAGLSVWLVAAAVTGLPLASAATALPPLAVVALVEYSPGGDASASPSTVRRRLVGTVGGVFGFSLVAYFFGSQRSMPPRERLPPQEAATRLAEQARDRELDVEGIHGLVSTIEQFYEVDINSIDPMIDADQWELSVTGAVDESFVLSYEDLLAMPAETKYKTLRCVGEGLNSRLMDNAIWTGVPVAPLLERAGPQSGCECVLLRAEDGYFEAFPLAALETGFLAYGMNGQSLPRGHGYPVRALIPGHWGEINVKWLTEIEILDQRVEGFWERRGWHGTGPVNTVAKIWSVEERDDGSVRAAGHAYAGIRGIDRVEISTDAGTTWTDATLSEPLAPEDVLGERDAWRQWAYTWSPAAGEDTVTARATDGTGTLQPRENRSPFPSGASGWVSVTR